MLFEDQGSLAWAGEALDDLLGFGCARARRALDPRAADAAHALGVEDPAPSLAQVAARSGLSPSRLRHLFAAEVGVPFRRYRAWTRMRRAIAEIADGANFTTAAHAAGFADQAHFAHDFRRTFGAPASRSLTGVRR
jgi:AraC-like DNA-binding protein